MNTSYQEDIRLDLIQRINAERARRFVLNAKIEEAMRNVRDLELLRNEAVRREDNLVDELGRKFHG